MSALLLSECSQGEHLAVKREYPSFKFCPDCTGELPSFGETLLGEELIDLTNIDSLPPSPPAWDPQGPRALSEAAESKVRNAVVKSERDASPPTGGNFSRRPQPRSARFPAAAKNAPADKVTPTMSPLEAVFHAKSGRQRSIKLTPAKVMNQIPEVKIQVQLWLLDFCLDQSGSIEIKVFRTAKALCNIFERTLPLTTTFGSFNDLQKNILGAKADAYPGYSLNDWKLASNIKPRKTQGPLVIEPDSSVYNCSSMKNLVHKLSGKEADKSATTLLNFYLERAYSTPPTPKSSRRSKVPLGSDVNNSDQGSSVKNEDASIKREDLIGEKKDKEEPDWSGGERARKRKISLRPQLTRSQKRGTLLFLFHSDHMLSSKY